ncbi:hypothetical protein ACOSQ3_014522 [Xanthoceras sorbifolium]
MEPHSSVLLSILGQLWERDRFPSLDMKRPSAMDVAGSPAMNVAGSRAMEKTFYPLLATTLKKVTITQPYASVSFDLDFSDILDPSYPTNHLSPHQPFRFPRGPTGHLELPYSFVGPSPSRFLSRSKNSKTN